MTWDHPTKADSCSVSPTTTRTVPASPSTSSSCPSWKVVVAQPVPTTAGMRYSRATTALCDNTPPVSVTTAQAVANSGVQGGTVDSATSTDPACSLLASASE